MLALEVTIVDDGGVAVTVKAVFCRPNSPITSSFDPVVVTEPLALAPEVVAVTRSGMPEPVSNGAAVLTPSKATITPLESSPPV